MESDGDTPPFWSQPSTSTLHRRRRNQSSPFLSPVVLILVIPVLIVLILLFVVRPFFSHTNQILKPNSVKKSWDSFNILLVLFAILCGVFIRRNDEASSSDDSAAVHRQNSDTISNLVNRPRQSVSSWLDYPEQREYSNGFSSGGGRLRRSSSSYPDLRLESSWGSGAGGERTRYFDDFEVGAYHRSTPPENFHRRQRWSREAKVREVETLVRDVPVDKFAVNSVPAPPTPPKSPAPPAPPPPPPRNSANLKRRRSLHSVSHKVSVEKQPTDEAEISERRAPFPPPAPPPPPPRPVPVYQFPEKKIESMQGRKHGATREITTSVASTHKGHRKKRKEVKSRDIYNSATESSSQPPLSEPRSAAPAIPPPPPPPPPPSKFLMNLFRKSSKSKRVHSIPTGAPPPPPPPPPPPKSIFNNLFKTGSKSKRYQISYTAPSAPPPPPPPSYALDSAVENRSRSRRSKRVGTIAPPAPPPPPQEIPRRNQINAGKPPKPTKTSAQYHEKSIIAPPSPLIPLPPPPPPPPFRISEVKFVAKGDFVRILSAHSSRCSSPELEDVDVVSVKSDGGESVGPSITCPSPDVNVKADSFIARRRNEWRLEKMNSLKDKQVPTDC